MKSSLFVLTLMIKFVPESPSAHATFLEIDILIEEQIYIYKLFDKRDDFSFSIVRMPDLNCNILNDENNIFWPF